MTVPPDVVDVVPPDHLPPVRPRSRVQSVLLVLVAFVVTCSLGFIPAASAAPILLIPAAKGVAAIGASVLTEKAFDAMWNGTGDKPADDDDSDSAKKGRGKWGQRLKGLRDVGSGLLGALFGLSELNEQTGDGLPMPEDFSDDLAEVNEFGTHVQATRYSWTVDPGSAQWVNQTNAFVTGPVLTIEATCHNFLTLYKCPTPGNAASVSLAEYHCFNTITGGWFVSQMTSFRVNGLSESVPCNLGSQNGGLMPVASVILRTPETASSGFSEASRFYNPSFDWSITEATPETITAEAVCTDPATGQQQTVSKSVVGREVIPTVTCPVGWVPDSVQWTRNAADGTTEWLGGMEPKTPDAYPDCPPGRCVRVITVDDVPCRVGIEVCYDWQNVQPPSRVKCEYGPYDMPLSECADLAHIHKTEWGVTQDPRKEPQRQPGWLPSNPDGTVDWTRVGTDVRPNDNPNPDYRPPVRGPIVNNPTLPDTDPPPLPDPPTAPMPPTVSVPNPPGNPKDPDNPTRNCMGGMASWNPVDWIYTPVKCALTWAFVPPNGSGPNLIGDFRAKVLTAELGAWLAIPDDLFGSLPQGSGCMGPPLNMPEMLGGKTYYPLNACSEPMAKYANMSRSLITIVVVFYGMFSIVNSLTVAMTGYRMFDRETAGLAKQVT